MLSKYIQNFQHGIWDLLNNVGNINNIPDSQTYRQIRYYSVIGPAALPPEQLDRYNRLINDMLSIYNAASICALNEPFHCGLRLQPDITKIMAKDFTDTAEYWSFPFESPALNLDLEDAWEEVKPLYELLHAYVRRRLREYYGPERISRQAPLPAHILGNILAEDFFVSLNMSTLPLDFWQGSVVEEPLDRVVLCQPSAWDFCNRRDF
ncbi:hypothetical protein NQ314_008303, partial [Rhamnusium bicolor]